MMRTLRVAALPTLAAFWFAQPADAQLDINPAEWSRPNVMVEGMRAQSRKSGNGASRGQSSAQRARRTCDDKGRTAAILGRDHPKVRRLYALCAQAGY